MSLSLQGAKDIGSFYGFFSPPVKEPVNDSSLMKSIHSLECTANLRVVNHSGDKKPTQGHISTPLLHSPRYEKVLEEVTKKKESWKKEYYSMANQYISSVTMSPSFSSGLASRAHKVNAFQKSTREGYLSAFNYIAKNTNPNYFLGIFRNIISFFSTGALNQNCIFCSKAVDKNLAELTKGTANDFWVAEQTCRGSLPQNVEEKNYKAFVMQPEQNLSSELLASTRKGSRNIIMVPVKNKHFSHAMNLVRTEKGDIVIDGQSGRIYDLSSAKDRQRFDGSYGYRHLGVVQIYHTGRAPVLERASLG